MTTHPQAPASPQPEAEVQKAVAVTVEKMVESGNRVSWWVVLRRGKERLDDGKYGDEFKNRAEWQAACLRWILGQGDKPNIRDFMDATSAGAPLPEQRQEAVATVLRGPNTPWGHGTLLQQWENGARVLSPGLHKLYAAPVTQAVKVPLTEARILELRSKTVAYEADPMGHIIGFARALEAEHGIQPSEGERSHD